MGCGHRARCRTGQTNLCETGYEEVGFTRDGAAPQVAMPAAFARRLAPWRGGAGAVLTEPAAVVRSALSRAAAAPGPRVLVIGDGTVALLAVTLARLWSPAEVVLLGRSRPSRCCGTATARGARSC